MDDYYLLEWTYTPADFLEQELDLDVDGVTVAIRNGTAEARIEPARYEQDSALHERLHERLHEHLFQAFRGTQLVALGSKQLRRFRFRLRCGLNSVVWQITSRCRRVGTGER
jgi:hypothetical protein